MVMQQYKKEMFVLLLHVYNMFYVICYMLHGAFHHFRSQLKCQAGFFKHQIQTVKEIINRIHERKWESEYFNSTTAPIFTIPLNCTSFHWFYHLTKVTAHFWVNYSLNALVDSLIMIL